MASNDDLKEAILKIDSNADVKDKSNKGLEAILSALQFDQTAQKSKAEAAAKAKAEAEANAEEKKAPYTVKMGKALTSRRGIRSDGQDIKAADFNKDEKLGQVTLDAFVKSGHIDKN